LLHIPIFERQCGARQELVAHHKEEETAMSMQQDSALGQAPASDHAGKPSPAKGLLILLGVVVVIGLFIALTHTLAIEHAWVAFLFLLYWAGIEHTDFRKLPHCVVGAALGLTVAYLLHALPLAMGTAAFALCLVGILALIYCQIMGWFGVAINMVTMLFLTVGTIPLIQTGTQYLDLMVSLAVGTVYFPGIVWAGTRIAHRTVKAQSA